MFHDDYRPVVSPVSSADGWSILGADGRITTSDERRWWEVATPYASGEGTLHLLAPGAASLSSYMAARQQTLRAPDNEASFFRRVRARSAIGGATQILYHEIGYLHPSGRVSLETDGRGNVTVRVDHFTTPPLF